MKLPALTNPPRYVGLYIFDFGGRVSVGYTAREVAFLLDADEHKSGKVYKIHRAAPDGTLEIRGAPNPNFSSEEAMLFVRRDEAAARADFETLRRSADDRPPPCAAEMRLVVLAERTCAHATALIYPAIESEVLGLWLNEIGYRGGDTVEGGSAAAASLHGSAARTMATHLLFPPPDRTSRSREEVLATTHLAVQR
jgi:hypothetical protein